jgi:integrase
VGLLLAAGDAEEEEEFAGGSQDFGNVLDGRSERYWNDRRKRDRETREKRDRERIEALERELAELDRVEEPKREPDAAPAKAKLKRAKPVRKPLEPIETPELLAAIAQAQLQAALLAEQQRLFDEEAAIILLLAA